MNTGEQQCKKEMLVYTIKMEKQLLYQPHLMHVSRWLRNAFYRQLQKNIEKLDKL